MDAPAVQSAIMSLNFALLVPGPPMAQTASTGLPFCPESGRAGDTALSHPLLLSGGV